MKCINNGADGAKQVPTEAMAETCGQKKAPIFVGALFAKLRYEPALELQQLQAHIIYRSAIECPACSLLSAKLNQPQSLCRLCLPPA
jgi:hypothetical protein